MSKFSTQLQSSQPIQNISILSNWSLPRFSFGELVKWKWNFNGKTHDYHGIVLGLYYPVDQDSIETGWHYSIKVIHELNTSDCPQVSEIEDLHESLLEAC